MPAPIDEIIKRRVVQQWLNGDSRSKIADGNSIGEGTVSGIVSDFKQGVDSADFDSARELALAAKKQGLNLSELASNFRLHNFIKSSGTAEEDIESFIVNISTSDLPPEKLAELVNQLFNISNIESIPPDRVSGYIREKLEQKQKIDEQIKEADDILQSKNVSIETINEHVKLNEKLNEYNLSFQDIDKLLNVLSNAKENGFDGKKIVAKLKKIQRLQNKEDKSKHHCEVLSEQVKKCNNVLPLAQKIVALNIDIQQLLVFDIQAYNKIGGLKREVSRLSQQTWHI